jgi:hypothetical protein
MSSQQLLIARLAKKLYESITEEIATLNERHTFIICRNGHYCEQLCFHKLNEKQKEQNMNRQKMCRKILDVIDENLGELYMKRNEQLQIHNNQRLQLETIGIKIQPIGLYASGGNSDPLPNEPKRNKEFEIFIDNMIKDKNNFILNEDYLEEETDDEEDIDDYGELNKAFIV